MKGYIFRLYPNKTQKEQIEKSFGCYRYIYNYFLNKNKNYINAYESIKELPKLVKENTWLSEIDSCLLRCSIFNLEDSFKRYSKSLSNYPKFKSRNKAKPSYRTNNITSTYKKIKNTRKYFLHSISNKIVNENDIIVTEKLQINKMVQNKIFSKKIYDASWYELIRQLEYKSKWKNKQLYRIETYYPSSQICSRCGYQNKETKELRIRKWECIKCTNINERDINASINIMFEGIKKYIKTINELQVI